MSVRRYVASGPTQAFEKKKKKKKKKILYGPGFSIYYYVFTVVQKMSLRYHCNSSSGPRFLAFNHIAFTIAHY